MTTSKITTGSPEPAESYRQLYAALKTMREDYTPVSEPRFEGYYSKVSALYDGLRQMQQELPRARRSPARTWTHWRRRHGRCSAPSGKEHGPTIFGGYGA